MNRRGTDRGDSLSPEFPLSVLYIAKLLAVEPNILFSFARTWLHPCCQLRNHATLSLFLERPGSPYWNKKSILDHA
jgi:hypothetical protein